MGGWLVGGMSWGGGNLIATQFLNVYCIGSFAWLKYDIIRNEITKQTQQITKCFLQRPNATCSLSQPLR